MRKSKKKTNTEQSIEEIFSTIGNTEDDNSNEEKKEETEEKYDLNGMEVVLERIEAGLIGSLLITDSSINKPLLKKGDYVHLRAYAKLLPRDIVLYKDHDDYFIRRIIKFENDEIWVAGDNERHFRIIHKDNVIAKALGRIRGKKFLSFGLEKNGYRLYANWKVYFNGIRLANRVMTFDEETNTESFELAMQNFEAQQQQQQQQQQAQEIQIASDIDLDSDLADFLNPDDLVKELQSQQFVEEEVYVDADGNEISKEEYEALVKLSEEESDASDDESIDENVDETLDAEETETEEVQEENNQEAENQIEDTNTNDVDSEEAQDENPKDDKEEIQE